jgi:hypothetical protein
MFIQQDNTWLQPSKCQFDRKRQLSEVSDGARDLHFAGVLLAVQIQVQVHRDSDHHHHRPSTHRPSGLVCCLDLIQQRLNIVGI